MEELCKFNKGKCSLALFNKYSTNRINASKFDFWTHGSLTGAAKGGVSFLDGYIS